MAVGTPNISWALNYEPGERMEAKTGIALVMDLLLFLNVLPCQASKQSEKTKQG